MWRSRDESGHSEIKGGGVSLEDAARASDIDLGLNGLDLRKNFFVKVYVGGLYLPEKSIDAEAILEGDAIRHLVMDSSVRSTPIPDRRLDDCLEANSPDASADAKQASTPSTAS